MLCSLCYKVLFILPRLTSHYATARVKLAKHRVEEPQVQPAMALTFCLVKRKKVTIHLKVLCSFCYTLKTGDNLDSFLLETKVFFDNWSHEKEATPLSAKLCSQSRQGNRWSLTSKQMLHSSSSQTSLATRAIYSGFVSSHYMANIF